MRKTISEVEETIYTEIFMYILEKASNGKFLTTNRININVEM